MGAVFSMLGGLYFWFEKITGVCYSEVLGKIHFWSFFIGVNLTFFSNAFLRCCRNAKTDSRLSWCIFYI
jgi:cytochrome c oxidase subunit 1